MTNFLFDNRECLFWQNGHVWDCSIFLIYVNEMVRLVTAIVCCGDNAEEQKNRRTFLVRSEFITSASFVILITNSNQINPDSKTDQNLFLNQINPASKQELESKPGRTNN